jgi:hypothetical protein
MRKRESNEVGFWIKTYGAIFWVIVIICGFKGFLETALLLGGLYFLTHLISLQLGTDQELTRQKIEAEADEIKQSLRESNK